LAEQARAGGDIVDFVRDLSLATGNAGISQKGSHDVVRATGVGG